jgi:hypothetical protein
VVDVPSSGPRGESGDGRRSLRLAHHLDDPYGQNPRAFYCAAWRRRSSISSRPQACRKPAASLPQAHSLLDGQQSILAGFIAAAAKEMRLSRGVLIDPAGVKERAATSFAKITRTEARGIRFGMGSLATQSA